MYLPLGVHIAPADLTNLIFQLPPPFIFLGGFYAKNIPWGSVLTDALDLAFCSPELAVHL
jgi:hypothetical protein